MAASPSFIGARCGPFAPTKRTKSYLSNFNNCSGICAFAAQLRHCFGKILSRMQINFRKQREEEGEMGGTGHARVMTVTVTLTRSEQVTSARG